jgi:hypothetical protein
MRPTSNFLKILGQVRLGLDRVGLVGLPMLRYALECHGGGLSLLDLDEVMCIDPGWLMHMLDRKFEVGRMMILMTP